MTFTRILLITLSQVYLVFARPDGAPFGSCLTLSPQHGSKPSQPPLTSPYFINITKAFDATYGMEKVQIAIYSPNRTMFKGFVIQARYANNPDIIVDGEFLPNEGLLSRTYSCKPSESMKKNVSIL